MVQPKSCTFPKLICFFNQLW